MASGIDLQTEVEAALGGLLRLTAPHLDDYLEPARKALLRVREDQAGRTKPDPIADAAIEYVKARARRNAAKAIRNGFECEAQDEAEHDDVGVVHRGWAPCYVRGDGDRCSACVHRDAAHERYLKEARDMGALWRKLKRTVEGATA